MRNLDAFRVLLCHLVAMAHNEENDAISALTGLSLGSILGDLNVTTDSLNNQLGISGIPALSSKQIYNENYDDEDAVGLDQGDDWEAQIDLEMAQEGDDAVKMEFNSPTLRQKQKRTRIVKRLIERPKTVYERFPAFEKDKVLDFSELFKGYTARKSRVGKRQFAGTSTFNLCPPPSC